MYFNTNDYIGFAGVFLSLIAFLLNLLNRLSKDSLLYIVLNIFGGGFACLAAVLIHYIPFIVLEGIWMIVSIIALVNFTKNKFNNN